MTAKLLKAVDFFCGAGGMTQGMKMAGVKVVAGIDIDEDCKETYEKNHPETRFFLKDIKKLPRTFLEKKCGVKRNDDSLVFIGCSPCQYWSVLNTNRRSSEGSKGLLQDFWRFVYYYNPGYVIIENVPGMKRKEAESGLDNFCEKLKEKGHVITENILNAKDYGVPQSRKRFVLIASRMNESINFPKPEKESILAEFIGTHNGFPALRAGHIDDTDFMDTVASLSEKNLRRVKLTPKNGGTRKAWKDDPELQLKAYKGKDDSFRDVYGRLRWNKPSSTITTRFNGISNGRFTHPEEDRGLSLREGATLQTFEKDYIFVCESSTAASKLIGNAVPPQLAYRIAQSICAV
ncbi:DNA cytosine methyltransferase [Candidatus Spongiihabitans sp.]|uniref:DNA cytosine methyltransferase n=1 Tax=Candidatus Spongiihabitans sp. TaxID=3101308 RepID=UPI003C6F0A37